MLAIEIGASCLEQKLVMMKAFKNNDGWKWICLCLKSQFTSSFLNHFSFVSPGFGELEWYDLELVFFLYVSDWSLSKSTVCREGLRAESAKWDDQNTKNTHYKKWRQYSKILIIWY